MNTSGVQDSCPHYILEGRLMTIILVNLYIHNFVFFCIFLFNFVNTYFHGVVTHKT